MTPVFGLGIAGEEQFFQLPSVLPEELSFLEIPGSLLELPGVISKLKKISSKQGKALVIKDIMPDYLADALPTSPLRLKVEFDDKFSARCHQAAELGARVIALNFNIPRALNEARYETGLLDALHSVSGVLERYKLIMALPLAIPGSQVSSFLAFKHRLFYPGFRFRIDFYPNDPDAFSELDGAMEILSFDRNFWRVPYRSGGEKILDLDLMEKLRPHWKRNGRTPVFVSIDSGSSISGDELVEDLTYLLRDFLNEKEEKALF